MASDVNQDDLARIKDNISTAYLYFRDNYERYRTFRSYVFKESVTDRQRDLLRKQSRPDLEFNILEAYISRLLGEFSKHEPSIDVSPSEGVPVDDGVINVVEQHFRHILYQANKNSFSYEVYKDLLSGGFSVAKVWTDYASSMSFNQEIYLKRVFDPTLCGFDPMARDSHKADGNFCFEIYPMTEKDFKQEFPDVPLQNLTYATEIEGFGWSYKDIQNNKIVLVADYYEKKKKRVKIVQLTDGRVMTAKQYKKFEQYWEEQQFIEQIPKLVGKPRMTVLETVCCTRLMENQVLEYHETDYSYLPLIFIDGHSIILSQGKVNSSYQMTRPYVYHAKGVQDLKNYAGQCLGNYLQTMVQHKFIIKKEAIVQQADSLEALKNIQRANTIIVNAYSENNPDKPIQDPIREVVNVPAPPEVMGTFQVSDPTTQAILGSFASNLGKNDNDLSGKAVIESSSVGNAAAMPYVVGYLNGLTQIANVCVDLLPKYIIGKRTIPVIAKNGDKDYQEVNTRGNPALNYNERALKVHVEAGVNFQVQKNQAVQQIIALMSASPALGDFFNDEDGGLPILAKNLTIYGADELPEAIDRWAQKKEKMKQEAMKAQQEAMQSDPRMIKAQADVQRVKVEEMAQETKARQAQMQEQLDIAELAIEKELADAKILEAEARVSQSQIDSAVALEKANTSLEVHALDSATKIAEIHSREHDKAIKSHAAGLAERQLEHDIKQSKKGANNEDTKV